MRSFALVLAAAIFGCSSGPSEPSDPTFHRDCAAPTSLRCSSLAILTPREPIGASSVPIGPLFWRGDGFDAFQLPALLQHYVVDGTPPRFHATSNAILAPASGYGTEFTSDGTNWYVYVNGSPEHLRAWDASNAPLVDVQLGDKPGANYGDIAAFQGLALVRHADYGATDRLYLYDTNGVLGWSQTGGIAASHLSAYGCGFALVGGAFSQPSLTTVPLDGRARSQQAGAMGSPAPWPYDPHGVAFLTASTALGGACGETLLLAFDDGRPPLQRSFQSECVDLNWQPQVLTTSFGAVLSFGNGGFVLLDDQGNEVGSRVQVDLQGDETGSHIGAGGDFIAVVVNEETFSPTPSFANIETILGCAP